jgi:hypothetical protein
LFYNTEITQKLINPRTWRISLFLKESLIWINQPPILSSNQWNGIKQASGVFIMEQVYWQFNVISALVTLVFVYCKNEKSNCWYYLWMKRVEKKYLTMLFWIHQKELVYHMIWKITNILGLFGVTMVFVYCKNAEPKSLLL